jgi:hypothetical protein
MVSSWRLMLDKSGFELYISLMLEKSPIQVRTDKASNGMFDATVDKPQDALSGLGQNVPSGLNLTALTDFVQTGCHNSRHPQSFNR